MPFVGAAVGCGGSDAAAGCGVSDGMGKIGGDQFMSVRMRSVLADVGGCFMTVQDKP